MREPFPLPVAEYLPDQPDAIGSDNIVNVYPRTVNSYGPLPSLTAASPSVTFNSFVRGATAVRDLTGLGYIFSGDDTNLYRTRVSTNAHTTVSVVDNSYSTGPQTWRFAHFNNHLVATNFNDALQDYELGVSTDFAVLAAAAPFGRYIATVKNVFLVLAYTNDGTNGVKPQRVWWCAAGDHTNWPIPGTTAAATVQSGATDLLGDGGAIQGIAADLVNADAVIFQERAVRRMQYTGSPVFEFLPIENAIGCMCPNSIVTVGGVVYYWSQSGIRAFDGAESRSIGAGKVDRTVYATVAAANFGRVVGVSDPLRKMVWWMYPSVVTATGTAGLLGYNWELDRFSYAEIVLTNTLVPTVNDEGSYGMAGVVPNADPVTFYRLSYFTGAPLAATVETQELEPNPGGNTFVDNCTPLVDGGVPSVSVGYRLRREDSTTYPTATAVNRMGECGVRTSGRFLKARITIPASDTGWSHISGVELGIVKRGRR